MLRRSRPLHPPRDLLSPGARVPGVPIPGVPFPGVPFPGAAAGSAAGPRPTRTLPMALALVAALAVAPGPASHLSAPAGLGELLAAPFPSDLTPSPAGDAVAWVQNDRGYRNIWLAEGPEHQPRMLTSYREDDGQELGSFTWVPDASALLYVRGGAPNRQGEIPNPESRPVGAERALWWIPTEGGEPVRLGEGSGPAVHPDGSGVAFLRGGDIWYVGLEGLEPGLEEPPAEPRILVRVRGGPSQLRWSPDGSRLAFVSNRGTHSFVGVYQGPAVGQGAVPGVSEGDASPDAEEDPTGGTPPGAIRWMNPSVDRDGNPAWSPDGSRLAFIRIPTSSDLTLFQPVREARPWSIRLADPSSGESREIWRAERGPGSAFWGMNAENQLLWAAGDRIVFPWEVTGWVLLYSVPTEGGEATLLTPGEFEVEHVALSPDRRHLYYSSNQDDLHRRHLWRVSVAGDTPEALTSGDGLEWAPAPLADGSLAFLRSGARTPAHAAFLPAAAGGSGGAAGARAGTDRARPLLPRGEAGGIPADFPEAALVVPTHVTVTASDGMAVPAQLFLPPDLQPGERRPAVAFFHGGSRRQMLLGFHYLSYYHHTYAFNQHLASRGYVVLSVNFRSGTGYGMAFREAVEYGAAGGSEFHDVTGAGLYLKGRPDVDPNRIGLWGGSYGGYLTAMGLSRASDLYAAGVDVHGVHDWNVGIATFRPEYDPLDQPEMANTAFQASPMATIDGWRSPVLLIHGDDDRNVRFVETVTLVEALRDREVHVEQLIFPDEVHSFLLHRNWLGALNSAADFFHRMLEGGGG